MTASSTKPATSALTVIERRRSDHPTSEPLFANYQMTGQSATRALTLLSEEWDVGVLGPLFCERTAWHWAQVDA